LLLKKITKKKQFDFANESQFLSFVCVQKNKNKDELFHLKRFAKETLTTDEFSPYYDVTASSKNIHKQCENNNSDKSYKVFY
jgi:hypothetical protein